LLALSVPKVGFGKKQRDRWLLDRFRKGWRQTLDFLMKAQSDVRRCVMLPPRRCAVPRPMFTPF